MDAISGWLAPSAFPEGEPLVIVISGPSGVGKDAILSKMKEMGYPLYFTVTATTRTKRNGEVDGVDYFFITHEEFEKRVRCGEFLEWAKVYGNFYGVPKDQIRQSLEAKRDVIIKTDVQGADTIRKLLPDAVFIFVVPPSMDVLAYRLQQRRTESAEEFATRIHTAQKEMECITEFDYSVVNENDGVDEAVLRVCAIIIAEKCKVTPRRTSI